MIIIKLFTSFTEKIGSFLKAIQRFPAAFLCLVLITVFNSAAIENTQDYSKLILTLLLGVFLFAIAQIAFERFMGKGILRGMLMLGAVALIVVYYLLIFSAPEITTVIGIRTAVAVFALTIAFIWIPSIKENVDFNDIFMAIFKSIFTSAFFSAVIWGGLSLIIAAIDRLLFRVGSNAYEHTMNIIWCLFAPMLFFSMIPIYNGEKEEWEKSIKASHCPKFLEILLSYVLIPLVAAYTLVLLIYMIKTIVISNWTDNLLEPLILSYCIAVLLLYILTSKLKNRFVSIFRFLFPKLLVPVAIFQIVSSIIMVYTGGIIHSRYFVLIFSLYSALSGIFLSIIPVKRNGILAILAIAFSIISILPPIDAFTVSRRSQTMLYLNTLKRNKMIQDDQILPKADVIEKDKIIIKKSVQYMQSIDEIKSLPYLPEDFNFYMDFKKTFGFMPSENVPDVREEMKNFFIDSQQPLEIGNYDYVTTISFHIPNGVNVNQGDTLFSISKAGKKYDVQLYTKEKNGFIHIVDSNGTEILVVELTPMIESICKNESDDTGKNKISLNKMSFHSENSFAKLRIVFQNMSVNCSYSEMSYNATAYVFVTIK